MNASIGAETSGSPLNRRNLLKSAGLAMLGSSVLGSSALGSSTTPAQSGDASSSRGENGMTTDHLRKGMVGYQLAYEQFPVTELVELGTLVE